MYRIEYRPVHRLTIVTDILHKHQNEESIISVIIPDIDTILAHFTVRPTANHQPTLLPARLELACRGAYRK